MQALLTTGNNISVSWVHFYVLPFVLEYQHAGTPYNKNGLKRPPNGLKFLMQAFLTMGNNISVSWVHFNFSPFVLEYQHADTLMQGLRIAKTASNDLEMV